MGQDLSCGASGKLHQCLCPSESCLGTTTLPQVWQSWNVPGPKPRVIPWATIALKQSKQQKIVNLLPLSSCDLTVLQPHQNNLMMSAKSRAVTTVEIYSFPEIVEDQMSLSRLSSAHTSQQIQLILISQLFMDILTYLWLFVY